MSDVEVIRIQSDDVPNLNEDFFHFPTGGRNLKVSSSTLIELKFSLNFISS